MLWFVLTFLNVDCLLYHHRMTDLKNMNRIAMLPICHQKMDTISAHQIAWNVGLPLEGHLAVFTRFNSKEVMFFVTAWFL